MQSFRQIGPKLWKIGAIHPRPISQYLIKLNLDAKILLFKQIYQKYAKNILLSVVTYVRVEYFVCVVK